MNFIINQIKEVWLGLPMVAKIIIIFLLALLIYYLVKKYGGWLRDKFQSSDINYKEGENPNNAGYTAGGGDIGAGKEYIERIAGELYADIYDTPWTGHSYTPYLQALGLSDNDLKYLADHYKKYLTKGTSLFVDIDDEVFAPGQSLDSDLMARLTKIGAK